MTEQPMARTSSHFGFCWRTNQAEKPWPNRCITTACSPLVCQSVGRWCRSECEWWRAKPGTMIRASEVACRLAERDGKMGVRWAGAKWWFRQRWPGRCHIHVPVPLKVAAQIPCIVVWEGEGSKYWWAKKASSLTSGIHRGGEVDGVVDRRGAG